MQPISHSFANQFRSVCVILICHPLAPYKHNSINSLYEQLIYLYIGPYPLQGPARGRASHPVNVYTPYIMQCSPHGPACDEDPVGRSSSPGPLSTSQPAEQLGSCSRSTLEQLTPTSHAPEWHETLWWVIDCQVVGLGLLTLSYYWLAAPSAVITPVVYHSTTLGYTRLGHS